MSIFNGIRMLDLSRLLPGGLCTKLFADLGAEVIKVEEPKLGDYCRWEKPFVNNESYYHLIINGNKKSIKLDLKTEEGKSKFLKLVETSDVVFENFRPGVMERLGLGYGQLKKVNERIILCSMSGFGQQSPYRDLVAHDINYLAMAGFLDLMIDHQKDASIPAVPIADVFSALAAAFAIAATLWERQTSGQGQHVDVSMYDTVIWSLSFIAGKFFADRDANLREFCGTVPSYSLYPTKDGKYVALGAFESKFWNAFCEKLGREDLIPYGKADGQEGTKIREQLTVIFKQKNRDEWIEFFKDVEVCISPVRNLDEVFNDEHAVQKGVTYTVRHPTEGEIRQLSHPIRYSRTNTITTTAAPAFGEHTEEILGKIT